MTSEQDCLKIPLCRGRGKILQFMLLIYLLLQYHTWLCNSQAINKKAHVYALLYLIAEIGNVKT